MDVFLQARHKPKMTTKSEQSSAEPRQAGSSEAKLSRVDRHQPAGLIHPNTRSPASGGLYWYCIQQFLGRAANDNYDNDIDDDEQSDDENKLVDKQFLVD